MRPGPDPDRLPAAAPQGAAAQPLTATAVTPACAHDAPAWDSRQLLAGGSEALIRHEGGVYRLRRTGLGKLILTK